MSEMIIRMIGNDTVMGETRLADFATVVVSVLIITLFAKYLLPYMRR